MTSGRSASSVHRVPALSLGIDGLLFTEAVVPGRSALECVSGLCRKLEARFVLEVWSEDGAAFVRFIRPRALC